MKVIIICIVSEVILFIVWSMYCRYKCPYTAVILTSAEFFLPWFICHIPFVHPFFLLLKEFLLRNVIIIYRREQ